MPLPTDGPVVIADCNPEWPRVYEEERARIVEAIGGWLVDIQHVGSTSVPGLAAKPVVDIMPGMHGLDDAEQIIASLETLGYEHVPASRDDIPDRRDFWKRHIAFRDYLRAHPETAAEYAALKRRLAAQYGSDRLGYVNAKTDFIRSVEELALASEFS